MAAAVIADRPVVEPAKSRKSARPSRKWWAGVITALAALAVNLIEAGHFSKEILIALVGLVAQGLIVYMVANDDTPGGAEAV